MDRIVSRLSRHLLNTATFHVGNENDWEDRSSMVFKHLNNLELSAYLDYLRVVSTLTGDRARGMKIRISL